MNAIPTAEKFKGHKPIREIAKEAGCSYDHVNRLRLAGVLECIRTFQGHETTIGLLHEAWRKRAEARPTRGPNAGKQKPAEGKRSKPSRRDRANKAALAAFGVPAGEG